MFSLWLGTMTFRVFSEFDSKTHEIDFLIQSVGVMYESNSIVSPDSFS